ncbi:helix-turn-helix domain-containing protein [Anaerococcus sp. Marseille-P3915]|uniref:helix-turn-helix domain-containing protein n=1 Tax=Anaerococcus sp. Marseille-P3915 TaxID=2057799 RepID=UPI000D0B74FD|nr:helix-turn-helix domain-containing protein [Anaerococcus sp. Marseille-P3915]
MTKNQDFGKLLKDIRIGKRLRQEDVEYLTGISVRSLSRLENGNIKSLGADSLILLSQVYDEDLFDIYYRIFYEFDNIYHEIINSLDISSMFMDHHELYLISKKLEYIENYNNPKKNEKNIKLLRLFVDRLNNRAIDKNEYRDRYEDITTLIIKKDINFDDINNIEARILAHICNDFNGYKNYEVLDFFNLLNKTTKSEIVKFMSKYYYVNKLFDQKRYEESKQGLIELLYSSNSMKTVENLSLLYYLMFLCEYFISGGNDRMYGIISLQLSKLSRRKNFSIYIDSYLQTFITNN